MKKLILLFFFILVTLMNAQPVVREVPVTGLSNASAASYDATGPVIYYEPQKITALGPLLTAFIRAHEYAHHFLGHIGSKHYTRYFQADPYSLAWSKAAMEYAADDYACRSQISRPDILSAAADYFDSLGDYTDGFHPTGHERASFIRGYISISHDH